MTETRFKGLCMLFVLIFGLVSNSYIVGAYTLSYDTAGNLIEDDEYTYEYNEFNQLFRVYDSSDTLVEEYFYAHTGERIKKVHYFNDGSNETIYYIGDFERKINSSGSFDTIYFRHMGQIIARNESGVLYFYHPDHLGSNSVITDENGEIIEKTTYQPFGAVFSGGENSVKGYTGKELDDTGLMYYGARFYSPEIRHFIQPDPMLPDIYDPQQLNRYSYVRNNPYKYTDPSGNYYVLASEAWVPYSPGFRFPTVNPFGTEIGFPTILPPSVDFVGFTINFPGIDINEYIQDANQANDNVEYRVEDKTPEEIEQMKEEVQRNYQDKSKDDFWKEDGKKADFEPDKGSKKQGKIKYDKQGRAIDEKGNKWKYISKERRFEKYYSDKFGDYDNIDPDGVIRHKGRSTVKSSSSTATIDYCSNRVCY